MSEKITTILLTGPPGVGKTTLFRKICEELCLAKLVECRGFYTTEVRTEGIRIGFDVVTLTGEVKPLARDTSDGIPRRPKVGKYFVHTNEFEELVMPLISQVEKGDTTKQLFVIDEIGKMELLSKKFKLAVNNLLSSKAFIFATIPPRTHQSIQIIEQFRNAKSSKVYEITRSNRNQIQKEILLNINEMMLK